jgi:hypothetical protein
MYSSILDLSFNYKKIKIMKRYIIYIASLLFVAIVGSCDMRSYDEPILTEPEYNNPKNLVFITIKQLKDMFPAGTTYDTYNLITGTNKAIRARVSGNDESGNIYKTMYIQDNTGGIVLGVNLTGLFSKFRVGQEVIIELDSLGVGKYAGSWQIGSAKPSIYRHPYNGTETKQMDRMTASEFYRHVFRNGSPDAGLLPPKLYTGSLAVADITDDIAGTLIRLDDVNFIAGDVGKQFAPLGADGKPVSGVNVTLQIGSQQAVVRTSGYANFAADLVPNGTGSIVCMLTVYKRGQNTATQLVLRDRNDLIDFNNQ